MFKLVALVLGLAIGFGVGVSWSVRNPEKAKQQADEQERVVLEKQKELLQKLKSKLDQLASSHTGTGAAAGASGFLGGAGGGAKRDPEVDQLKSESDRQMAELDKIIKK